MRKHGGTPSRRDKQVTPAAISPRGVARGRLVGGQQSGPAGCKPPPLYMRGASFCSSQGQRQGEPLGASPRPSAPTYLPLSLALAMALGSAMALGPATAPKTMEARQAEKREKIADKRRELQREGGDMQIADKR